MRLGTLDLVDAPEDLKKLSIKELTDLAGDIREFLMWNVSRTGGHLGSNLGIVELTVALHRVFDSPRDKIIWDVGHQSYVHKILTGRKDAFGTLRKFGGLSGFTKRSESAHDPFGAGHSSTALSAAVGIARAHMLDGKNVYTIAVIGDGSFTGGLAYEALNNSKNCKNLIVILNDNEMSISKNVGTMADYLANIRTARRYYSFRHAVKKAFSSIPLIGKLFVKMFQTVTRLFRRSLYNATFFEQMGFDFLGPVDGHNITKLMAVLGEAKTRENPVFIHVKTQKGKGYKKAESSSAEYHSVGKFDIEEGLPEAKRSFSTHFGEAICAAAEKNEKILAVTAAMAEGTGLAGFREKYPGRFFDVGIAEAHAAVFSAGLAAAGCIPVFAVYATFLQRAYDQLIHDIALQNLHVVFCIDRAGLTGEDGATHHGVFDAAFLGHIPNMTVFSPSSYGEFDDCFDFAVNQMKSPVCIRYPKGGEEKMPDPYTESNLDYKYMRNAGAKYLFVSYGRISKTALEVCERLNGDGVKTEFLKLNKIKPVEYILPTIQNSEAENVVFVEEGIKEGGGAQAISSRIAKKTKIFALEGFVGQGTTGELLGFLGLEPEKIYEDIMGEL